MDRIYGILGSLFYIGFLLLPFIITYIKKKRQVGALWNPVLQARVRIAGKELVCSHCQCKHFSKREGILVTSWVAFFRFSFWNQSAACFECIQCGCVQWFSRPKEEIVEMVRIPEKTS